MKKNFKGSIAKKSLCVLTAAAMMASLAGCEQKKDVQESSQVVSQPDVEMASVVVEEETSEQEVSEEVVDEALEEGSEDADKVKGNATDEEIKLNSLFTGFLFARTDMNYDSSNVDYAKIMEFCAKKAWWPYHAYEDWDVTTCSVDSEDYSAISLDTVNAICKNYFGLEVKDEDLSKASTPEWLVYKDQKLNYSLGDGEMVWDVAYAKTIENADDGKINVAFDIYEVWLDDDYKEGMETLNADEAKTNSALKLVGEGEAVVEKAESEFGYVINSLKTEYFETETVED
ncbi:MAG: hypothetical protein K6F84_03755 [Lachnospiraceae bacterium]|nr:hypothetical protein [Lachnospiraceae bacterium]